MNLKLKIFLQVFSSVIISGVLAAGAVVGLSIYKLQANMSTSSNAYELMQVDSDSELEVPDTLPTDFYILLLGVDSNESRENGEESKIYAGSFRSDSIIVAHVNTDTQSISLLSLERDIKTDIDGYSGDYKLNAAYALGGVDLMMTEAEELVGVDISYYAIVDMDGLSDIIDSVGGVEVDVEAAFYDTKLEAGIDTAGVQTLDGESALVYCRSRYAWTDGDFARARHQRQVLQAIANKVMTGADVMSLYSAAETLSQNVATNLQIAQLYELAVKMMGIDTTNNIYSSMTPTVSASEDGVSYQEIDKTQWSTVLSDFIANDGGASRIAAEEAANANTNANSNSTSTNSNSNTSTSTSNSNKNSNKNTT